MRGKDGKGGRDEVLQNFAGHLKKMKNYKSSSENKKVLIMGK